MRERDPKGWAARRVAAMVSARQDSQALSGEGAGSLVRGEESRPQEHTANPCAIKRSKSRDARRPGGVAGQTQISELEV